MGKFFKQKQGTAIGTKIAPPYAILFMDDLENKIFKGFHLQPYILWRYIDDIWTWKKVSRSSLVILTASIIRLSLPQQFGMIQSNFWMLRLFVIGTNW